MLILRPRSRAILSPWNRCGQSKRDGKFPRRHSGPAGKWQITLGVAFRGKERAAQCGHACRDAEIASYHGGRSDGPGKGRPLSDDSGAGGESRGAASGASAADDVGIAAVVEYTCGADFSDRELGHRASSV